MILLNKTTAAATSGTFSPSSGITSTIVASGLSGTETITVQIYDEAQSAFVNLLSGGSTPVLDANNNALDFYLSAGRYQLVKPITANAVGISINPNPF